MKSPSPAVVDPVEPLEPRRLLAAVSLSGGVLSVVGTDAADDVALARVVDSVEVAVAGAGTQAFPAADVGVIDVGLLGGADRLGVGPGLGVPVSYNGGSGADALDFAASPGDDADGRVASFSLTGGGTTVDFAAVEAVVADFGLGADSILIDVRDGVLNGGPTSTTVRGGGGDDRFTIRATPPTINTVHLFGGEGDDVFAVEPGVVAVPTVTGEAGQDRIEMVGTAGPDVVTLTQSLPGGGPRPVVVVAFGSTAAGLFFDGIEAVDIATGGGADRADLRGFPAGVDVRLNLGEGDDLARTDENLRGSFAGVDIDLIAGPGLDTARFQTGAAVPADLSLLGGVLSDPSLDLTLPLTAGFEAVELRGRDGDDSFTVEPSADFAVRVEGRGQATGDPGDLLDVVPPAGAAAELLAYDPATGAGTFAFGPGVVPIEFVGIETLLDADVRPPTVADLRFAFETGQAVVATFSEAVVGVGAGTIEVVDLATGAPLPAGRFVTTVTGGGDGPTVLTLRPDPLLPDGNYRATIPAGAVADAAGNPLAAGATLDFFVLAGDFNRDRRVNLADFTILANNFGQTGRTFGQGDATYDGRVNLSDFTVLANRFGAVLPPPDGGSLFD